MGDTVAFISFDAIANNHFFSLEGFVRIGLHTTDDVGAGYPYAA